MSGCMSECQCGQDAGCCENRRGATYFHTNSTNYETKSEGFRGEFGCRVKSGHSKDHGSGNTRANASGFKTCRVLWQFSGKHGNWHDFKQKSCCSVSSEDIEAGFRRNRNGSLNFVVNGERYNLTFSRMIQTSLKTGATRAVRRLEL